MIKLIIKKTTGLLGELNRIMHLIKKRPEYNKTMDLFECEKENRKELLRNHLFKLDKLNVKIGFWPAGFVAACNIQFDDFSPVYEKGFDFGGNQSRGASKLFFDALKNIRFAKATLFTIPDAKLEGLNGDYAINSERNNLWLEWVKSNKFNKTEIANHGLHHHQNDIKYCYTSSEFLVKNSEQSYSILTNAKEMMLASGIHCSGTRPPAYELGRKKSFISAARRAGFAYVAASTPVYGLNLFKKRVSNIYPDYYDNILNLPGNLSLHQPLEELKPEAERIINLRGIITLRGHYVYGTERLANGISSDTMNKLVKTSLFIKKKYKDKVWFATLSEIAKWWNAKSKISIELRKESNKKTLLIKNNSEHDIKNLSLSVNKRNFLLNITNGKTSKLRVE